MATHGTHVDLRHVLCTIIDMEVWLWVSSRGGPFRRSQSIAAT
jgi:hypothetical protein